MTAKLAKSLPPIHTADHKVISIGMTVFGVDTECSKDNVPKIEQLKVVDLDLGPRRQLRLLRKNGTEWTWSANEHSRGKGCRTSEQLVYANRRNAVKIARRTAQDVLEKWEDDDGEKFRSLADTLKSIRENHAYSISEARKQHAKRRKAYNALKTKIKAIK